MAHCETKETVRIEAIVAGIVLHSEDCEREWMILSADQTTLFDRTGVFAALYFDDDRRGVGVNAILFGQDIIKLHVSDQGLVHKEPK